MEWVWGAAVAGVTGDQALALEIVLVDVHGHFDHVAGNFFSVLIVFLEGASTWQ